MPDLSPDAKRRILRATRDVEVRLQRNERDPDEAPILGPLEDQWFQLQEYLPPGKSAPAYYLTPDTAANDGKGGYTPDTSETFLIWDFSQTQPAVKGEWVRALIYGADKRLCWEPLQGHEELWRFELTGDLYACGSAPCRFLDSTLQPITWVDEDGERHPYESYLYDPLGTGSEKADPVTCILSSGTRGYAKWMADAVRWELVIPGDCSCSSSSGGDSHCTAPYTGEVMVGSGALAALGCTLTQGTEILTYKRGILCGVRAGPVQSTVIDCCCSSSGSTSGGGNGHGGCLWKVVDAGGYHKWLLLDSGCPGQFDCTHQPTDNPNLYPVDTQFRLACWPPHV